MISHSLRLLWAHIQKYRRQFFLGFAAGVLLVIFLIFIFPKIPRPVKVTTLGLAGNYTITNLPLTIQTKISFGLTQASENFWATDSGKVWFFKIKPQIAWQDGKKLTAADINYQLADVRISAVDEATVRFDLESPFSPLPTITSQPLFRPGLIGLGDYKIKSLKNAGRFLKSLTLTNSQEEIVYKFYPTEQILKTAFKLGEVDVIQTSDTVSLENFRSEKKINYSEQVAALFNTRSGPTADKTFRQGLLYALSDMGDKFGSPSAGPLPPTSWGYNPQLKKYPFNFELSQKLIAKELASGSAKIKVAAPISLRPVAEKLKADWEKLGLEIITETADHLPENYEVFLTTLNIPEDPDQYQLWHSTSPLNLSGYKSPKSDKLLEEGRQTMDQKQRQRIYADWQKAITEDAPAAFLYFPYLYTIYRD
jgi:ABC-type transport system substrate-binding protein